MKNLNHREKRVVNGAGSSNRKNPYLIPSFCASVLAHIALGVVAIILSSSKYSQLAEPVIYSVTVESSDKLGGMTQVPKDDKEQMKAPPKNVREESVKPPVEEVKKQEVTDKKQPEPDPESDAEVSLKEQEPSPKPSQRPSPKPQATPKPKTTPVPKPKATPAPKPKATPKPQPKKREPTLAEIEKQLQQAVQRYSGASTDAGGEGFGSTGRGGRGMGGGQLKSPLFFKYLQTLERYIKSGWRWHDTSSTLQARVCFEISPTGTLSNVELCGTSGNRGYDDSVVRAVYKANPVPPPPPEVYDDFAVVRMTFTPGG